MDPTNEPSVEETRYEPLVRPGQQPVPGMTLRRLIGVGPSGQVWDAHDSSGNLVALKFLDCRTTHRSIISSEISVLRRLRDYKHPNIIRYIDVFSRSHYLILAMERADGNLEDLRQAYQAEIGQNVPVDHMMEMLDQAAEVLDFLAGLSLPDVNPTSPGLQHCDIKPSNLLLLGETIKIADFGLCAGAGWIKHRRGRRGTPPYMPPEQIRGNPAVGTDQYALAMCFVTLVAGRRAFVPRDPLSRSSKPLVDMSKIRHEELPVLARALDPVPSRRWPSCRAFVSALRSALQTERPAGGSAPGTEPRPPAGGSAPGTNVKPPSAGSAPGTNPKPQPGRSAPGTDPRPQPGGSAPGTDPKPPAG